MSRNIRKKERSCSTLDDNYEDQLLPPDHPSEIEYQFLKVPPNELDYHTNFDFRRKLLLPR